MKRAALAGLAIDTPDSPLDDVGMRTRRSSFALEPTSASASTSAVSTPASPSLRSASTFGLHQSHLYSTSPGPNGTGSNSSSSSNVNNMKNTGNHTRSNSLTSACLPASSNDKRASNVPSSAPWRALGLLSPLSFMDSPGTMSPESPRLGSVVTSVSLASGRRRPKPLLARLFQLAYLSFSLLYFTAYILGFDIGHAKAARRLIPRQASGQMPFSMNAGWEAWQAVKDRIPFNAMTSDDAYSSLDDGAENNMDDENTDNNNVELGSVDQELAKGSTEALVATLETVELPTVADETDGPTNRTIPSKQFDQVFRDWHALSNNPLSPMTHHYRFSKMHAKLPVATHENIIPFALQASSTPKPEAVTACLYTNPAWLELLPEFVARWTGHISLVVELPQTDAFELHRKVLDRLRDLRKSSSAFRSLVDVHMVTSPAADLRQLITKPVATNAHMNLARFFARTDVVFLVPDARIVPSLGLRRRLQVKSLNKLLASGDALVIPTFAPLRYIAGQGSAPQRSLPEVQVGNFAIEATKYYKEHFTSLPIPFGEWPKRKAPLVGLSSTKPPASVMSNGRPPPAGPAFALFDRSWDIGHGPSNWPLWRRGGMDPQLQVAGAGLGPGGIVGGGHMAYRVDNYELHYSPLVVMNREGHPWCNERFDRNNAACTYSTWLAGAELWVVPDEWAYTLEAIDVPDEADAIPFDEQLKEQIAARLYTKYHAEACMHYGREFLSKGLWETGKAKHLRDICSRVLGSWGIGVR